jgi:hypothetical protein
MTTKLLNGHGRIYMWTASVRSQHYKKNTTKRVGLVQSGQLCHGENKLYFDEMMMIMMVMMRCPLCTSPTRLVGFFL